MFTPEFVSDERGEFVLVANHSLECAEAIALSIAYNLARIAAGATDLPSHIQKCRVIYDVRGQFVPEIVMSQVRDALRDKCTLEFRQ